MPRGAYMNGIKIISVQNRFSIKPVNNSIQVKPYKNNMDLKQSRMYIEEGFYSPTQPYLIAKEGK